MKTTWNLSVWKIWSQILVREIDVRRNTVSESAKQLYVRLLNTPDYATQYQEANNCLQSLGRSHGYRHRPRKREGP